MQRCPMSKCVLLSYINSADVMRVKRESKKCEKDRVICIFNYCVTVIQYITDSVEVATPEGASPPNLLPQRMIAHPPML